LKLKLILVAVLAIGSMAHAQSKLSNLSIGVGFEGIFPAATFNKSTANSSFFPSTQSSTNSVGAVADARYDFGRHSAVDVAFTVNRNSEIFFNGNGENTSRVQTNNFEMIGTYLFRLPSNDHVKPYALFGGGIVRFAPNNNFTVGPNSPSASSKPAFAYGFGTDFPISPRLAIRLQYRGLLRSDPDFKLSTTDVSSTFGTSLRTHVPEPSIQLVYHF
jgi:opacity protein-like surface antigen